MQRAVFLGSAGAATLATLAPLAAAAQLSTGDDAIRLRFVRDEPDAVLAILADRAAGTSPTDAMWRALFASEGYRRLAEREHALKRAFDEPTFRSFVLSAELLEQRASLASALAAWSSADVSVCGTRALAYLPQGSRLRAGVYPEIKPAGNSFVYDLDLDPGIFLYLDAQIAPLEFTYTVAHELHHVGFAQNAPTPEVRAQIERLPAPLRSLQRWLGGFGEGFAVLAGAGGPDVDPATAVGANARGEWAAERATFEPRMRELSAFFRALLSGRLDGDSARDAGMAFFGNQGAWYTVGWRMAVTLERRFGRPRLIASIADVRTFMAAYNAAAAGTGLPRWDDDLANAFPS